MRINASQMKGKLLYRMLPMGLATRNALLSITPEEKYNPSNKRIHRLVKDGFLSKGTIHHKSKEKDLLVEYFYLTKDGLEFLLSHYIEDYPILKDMEALPSIRISNNEGGKATLAKLLRQNTSLLFAEAGYSELSPKFLPFCSKPSNPDTLETYVSSKKQYLAKEETSFNTPYLYTRNEVLSFSSGNDLHHFAKANFTHLFVGRNALFFSYHTSKSGLILSSDMLMKQCKIARDLFEELRESNASSVNAICFYATPEEFQKALVKNQNGIKILSLGENIPFQRTYVLPESCQGAKVLSNLLSLEDDFANWKRSLVISRFPGATLVNDGITDFSYANARYCIAAFGMEIKQLMMFENFAKRNPEESFVVIMEEWQEPLLKDCLPSCKHLVINRKK